MALPRHLVGRGATHLTHAFDQEIEAVDVGLGESAPAGIVGWVLALGHVGRRLTLAAEPVLLEAERDLRGEGIVELHHVDVAWSKPGVTPELRRNVPGRCHPELLTVI